MLHEAVPALGRVPHTEEVGSVLVETARLEEVPPGLGLWGLQGFNEELGRDPVGLDKPPSATPGGLRTFAPRFVPEGNPSPASKVLDGLGERQSVGLHEEGDDVAPLAAPETVPTTDAWPHVEGGGLLVVEGAEALEGADPAGLESDPLADNLLDAGAFPYRVDVVPDDAAGHEVTLCPMGPFPLSASAHREHRAGTPSPSLR